MSNLSSDVKSFYSYYYITAEITKANPSEWVVRTSLCNRWDFACAACDALAFLVYNVTLTIFSAIAVIFTLGFISSFKASFCKNGYEGLVHACTIPISIVGILFPEKINQDFLNLTILEYREPVTQNSLTDVLNIVGTIVLRKRHVIEWESELS